MFEFMGCKVYAPPEQMSAIVRTESSANLYAIGIVKHLMNRQPQSLTEALQVVQQLRMGQHNYSVGLAQVNQSNFSTYGLHDGNMFDKCSNLQAGSKILSTCYNQYKDWPKAYSCYYSGGATVGFRHGYVAKVLNNFSKPLLTIPLAPKASSVVPIRIFPRASQGGAHKAIVYASHITKPLTLMQQRLGMVSQPEPLTLTQQRLGMVSQPEPLTLTQQRIGITLQTEPQTSSQKRTLESAGQPEFETPQGLRFVTVTRASAQIPTPQQQRLASSVSPGAQTLRQQRLGSSVNPVQTR